MRKLSDECKTIYPIVLIHGLGFRDRKHLNYWGRIPGILQGCGANVYYGNQDSHGSVESNALQIKQCILKIIEELDCEKVNLIAHSKGGLDARYLISALEMQDYIASLTTISTPHHGSKSVDILLSMPKILVKICAFFSDVWYWLLGDKCPDSFSVYNTFSTRYAVEFNEKILDSSNVYYQSFAYVMSHCYSDFVLCIPSLAIKFIEGENDGLLTPASTQWTNFKGIIRSTTNRGISHCDEVDMRRRPFSRKLVEGKIADITDFYKKIVADLKCRGF